MSASAASTKKRLQRKLKSTKRLQAPCYAAFNRWVFLAQHNRIMFSNRSVLQALQDEYERGLRSGDDIKREAARIVEQNVQHMSALSAKLKVRINGREVFDLSKAQHQLWLKCVCPGTIADHAAKTKDSRTASGATCLIACRERVDDTGVVDVFFQANDGKSAFQYQFGMSSRRDALLFSGALYRELSAGTITADRPVAGAFAILCINLSHTPNEQVKFGILHGTVEPSQRRLRDVCVVRAQALVRGYALRLRRQRIGVCNGPWWQVPSSSAAADEAEATQVQLPELPDSKKVTESEKAAIVKRRIAKKKKKERQRRRKHAAVTRIAARARCWLGRRRVQRMRQDRRIVAATVVQQWWRSLFCARKSRLRLEAQVATLVRVNIFVMRKWRRVAWMHWVEVSARLEKSRLKKLSVDLVAFVATVDLLLKRLRPHHLRVIRRVKRAVANQLPFAEVHIYGSWPLALSIPSSDIDILVDWHAGTMKAQQAGSWRAALPPSVRGIGRTNVQNIGSKGMFDTSSSRSSPSPLPSPNQGESAPKMPYQQSQAFYSKPQVEMLFSRQEFSYGICSQLTYSANTNLQKSPLELVCSEMSGSFFVRRMRFIHSSNVPVIKLLASSGKTVGTGVPVDVDISGMSNTHLGLRARGYLRDQLFRWPRMRVLAIFLKQLLHDNNASDTASGGLRSFALMILLIRFYQYFEGKADVDEDDDGEEERGYVRVDKARSTDDFPAQELLAFLKLYESFDFSEQGISVDGTGAFFSLRDAHMHNTAPCCVMWCDRNVAPNASKLFYIQQLFRKTRRRLLSGADLSSVVRIGL